jgi:acyl carrier protein
MNDSAIYEKLTEIFRDVMDNETIVLTPATVAKDIPEWDSFNHVNVIVSIEMKFGIKLTTAEVENVKNVGDFVAFIGKKIGSR